MTAAAAAAAAAANLVAAQLSLHLAPTESEWKHSEAL